MADYEQMVKDANDVQKVIQLRQEAGILGIHKIVNSITLGIAYVGSLFNAAICGYSIAQHNDKKTIIAATTWGTAVILTGYIGRILSKNNQRAAEIRRELKTLESRVE